MGIVVKQSIQNLIITCLGFGIGAINTLFLYTNFLEDQYYGMVTYLIASATMMWPFVAFGAQNTVVKFFSSYTSTTSKNRFLGMMLFLPVLTTFIIGSGGYVLYPTLLSFFDQENVLVQPYLWTIFVLAFCMAYFEVFFALAKVQLKSVLGTFLKEVCIRLGVAILLVLVYFKVLSIPQFIYALTGVYGLRTLIMGYFALRQHPVSISFSLPENYKEILQYTLLIVIAGSVATVLIDLDKVMIERFLPIDYVAKYGLCAYIASVIILPSRAMHQITYPLTAQLINETKYEELRILYRKSSATLFVLSGLLFVLILGNVKQLFTYIPASYQLLPYVLLCIALGKLFDNFLGNNNAIVYTSKYYHIILWVGVAMAILAWGLNLFLLPIFGVTGAAMATFITIATYNSIKLWVVYQKFGMHPFSTRIMLHGLCILALAFGMYTWDFNFTTVLNIAIKSMLIVLIYGGIIYGLKSSPTLIQFVSTRIFRRSA